MATWLLAVGFAIAVAIIMWPAFQGGDPTEPAIVTPASDTTPEPVSPVAPAESVVDVVDQTDLTTPTSVITVPTVDISRSAKSGHKLVPVEESTVQEWTEIHEAVRQASHISRPMPRVPGRSADTFIDPTTISHAMTEYGFTVDDVWDVFDQAGFPEDVWDHAFCIVWHESNFRADNVGDTTIKDGPSLGWFQIDIYFWPIDRDQAFDPVYNATYAFTNIYGTHADPWQPWSTERTYCSMLTA